MQRTTMEIGRRQRQYKRKIDTGGALGGARIARCGQLKTEHRVIKPQIKDARKHSKDEQHSEDVHPWEEVAIVHGGGLLVGIMQLAPGRMIRGNQASGRRATIKGFV